jgi:hypothetical protein
MIKKRLKMRGQISLFVIIGILIVVAVGLTVYLTRPFSLSPQLTPAESRISECITNAVNDGASLAGEQAGYIELPQFEAGNDYSSSGSQLNFFGSVMPYWLYKSGNGLYKEQVPSIQMIGKSLESYVNQQMLECDFSSLEEQNYIIEKADAVKTTITINDNEILAKVDWPITVTFEDTKQRIASHDVSVKNNLGSSYKTARKIYESEKSKLFLEEYARDVIVLYAPGTDVELGCAPKIWSKQKVISDIKNALEANLQTIKFTGSYYNLRTSQNKYFVYDLGENIKNPVNVIYASSFPTNIEVDPSDGDIMRANPIGVQEGLGALGLCYVPYHFVYSASFPVIIQVFDENYNLFQFPVIVEIKNNLPRKSGADEQLPELEAQFCKYKVQNADVHVTDSIGNPIDNATVSYKCVNTLCNIGQTEKGELNADFPQCAGGFIVVNAEGYAPNKIEFSTNEAGGSATIIMPKMKNLQLSILSDGNALADGETAIISFVSPDYSTSVYYPDQKSVNLISGEYNISAMIFKSGDIILENQSSQKCINVPRQDILGLFGAEREECYTIETPAQTISQLIFGGGNTIFSASEDELFYADELDISAKSQNTPKTIDELQSVYDLVAASDLSIELK